MSSTTHVSGASTEKGGWRNSQGARSDREILVNFTPYFAWAGAEISVTMICIGIPTLRPLYLRYRGSLTMGYASRSRSAASELPQFTMCDAKPSDPYIRDSASSHMPLKPDVVVPARPPTAHTKETRATGDSIDGIVSMYDQGAGVIWVKNEVVVRRDDNNWPLQC